MQRLAERQAEFAASLLQPDLPPPQGLVGPDRRPSARRFAVYRNNVVVGLIDALKAAYPAVRRIVGDEFFFGLARAYVAVEPPRSPIILDYGAGLPDFIGGFEPAASLPYLRDVALIERAWTESYHAAEAEPLDPIALASIAPELLPDVRLVLHPSTRVVRSRLPAVTIWRMNVSDGAPAPVDLAQGGEDALIARPKAEVEVRRLPAGGAVFIQSLAKGLSLQAATETASAAEDGFDLTDNLEGLIRAGVLVDCRLAEALNPPESANRR
ncbi:MAG: DNA-binding domain-containing protein [Roseiarcus sp.]